MKIQQQQQHNTLSRCKCLGQSIGRRRGKLKLRVAVEAGRQDRRWGNTLSDAFLYSFICFELWFCGGGVNRWNRSSSALSLTAVRGA